MIAIEPAADLSDKPDFDQLLSATQALAENILAARAHGDDRGHLAVAHASLTDAWADIYKHKAGLP